MNIEMDEFMKLKNEVDSDTHAVFSRMIKYVDRKFISLSKSNIYKRIQKVKFINTPNNSNNIIHILNKLTADNYPQIRTKIFMKNTINNTTEFIEQILQYSIHSQINSKYLLAICHDLLSKHNTDTELITFTRKLFCDYFDEFVKYFDEFDNIDATNYTGFLNKNEHSAHQLNRCNFIVLALTWQDPSSKIFCDIEHYNIVNLLKHMLEKARNCLPLTEPYESKLSVILDSIKKLFTSCTNLNTIFDEIASLFQNTFDKNFTKLLNNKLRFKVLDIIDIINKR